eukprot:TRINITY_DN7448_c0_g1_i1.p1 TRINITY_DN7448_c0_g1~~TRINITY_DN7448_c0_g1_i1.p1  ORF type:complete len:126 (+),score=26.21 TRINITY_DN7448_c0_g1_i1:67-444(+)
MIISLVSLLFLSSLFYFSRLSSISLVSLLFLSSLFYFSRLSSISLVSLLFLSSLFYISRLSSSSPSISLVSPIFSGLSSISLVSSLSPLFFLILIRFSCLYACWLYFALQGQTGKIRGPRQCLLL